MSRRPFAAGPRASGLSALRCTAALCPALLAVLLLATGCASTVAPDLLALPVGQAPTLVTAPHPPGVAGPAVWVRRVSVPEYIASRRVRYWQSEGVLAEWPDTFWAERIEVALTREFTAALQEELPGWTVCGEAGCGESTPALTIKLDLQRLDPLRSERRLSAVAQWWVTAGPGAVRQQAASAPERLDLPVSADSAQAQAAAVTRLLRLLASKVAQQARSHDQAPAAVP